VFVAVVAKRSIVIYNLRVRKLGLTAGVVTSPYNAENIGFGTVNPNVNGMRAGRRIRL
jgi:hypothetical protein